MVFSHSTEKIHRTTQPETKGSDPASAPVGPGLPEGLWDASGAWAGTLEPNLMMEKYPDAGPGYQGRQAHSVNNCEA